jgi:hypothetical protein
MVRELKTILIQFFHDFIPILNKFNFPYFIIYFNRVSQPVLEVFGTHKIKLEMVFDLLIE